MSRIVRNRQIVDDDWTLVRLTEGRTADSIELPAGDLIVPLSVWQARRYELALRPRIGVWLADSEGPEEIVADLSRFEVIAVDFPKFVNGRGYSTAVLLRTRFGWRGELRAVGDVLHDQLFLMARCGFDAFVLRADQDPDRVLAAFDTFTDAYQPSADQPLPPFRRDLRRAA